MERFQNSHARFYHPLLFSITIASCASAQTAWEPAEPGGATSSELLNFNGGTASVATASMPVAPSMDAPTLGTGTQYNTVPATAVSGGWDLTATGATAVYAAGVNQASAQSSTGTVPGNLEFNAVSDGDLGEMKSANMPASWNAGTSITSSNSWTSIGNEFRYHLDTELNSSALSLAPGTMPSIGLIITDGAANELYHANNLGELLGITDLNTQSFDDVMIDFTYDPTTGPLKILWFGSATLSKNLLSGSTTNVLRVKDAGVFHQVAVPEGSTAALLSLAAGFLVNVRWRRSPDAA